MTKNLFVHIQHVDILIHYCCHNQVVRPILWAFDGVETSEHNMCNSHIPLAGVVLSGTLKLGTLLCCISLQDNFCLNNDESFPIYDSTHHIQEGEKVG